MFEDTMTPSVAPIIADEPTSAPNAAPSWEPSDAPSPFPISEPIDLTGTHDHYQVYVESKAFQGMTRINCHKHVMAVFSEELASGEVHALSIKTKALGSDE